MESCRACLRVACPDELRSLFDSHSDTSATAQLYSLLTSIEIKQTDQCTHFICSDCEQKLDDFQHFRDMCLASDKQIRLSQPPIVTPESVEIVVKAEPHSPTPNEHQADALEDVDEDTDDIDDNAVEQDDDSDRNDDIKSTRLPKSRLPKQKSPASLTKFQCDMCGQTFQKKHRIEAHLRAHVGLKPFCCAQCPSTFRKYSSLRMHQQRKHPDVVDVNNATRPQRRHACEVPGCTKTYLERSSLRTHMRRLHRGAEQSDARRLVCETCGQAFYTNLALADHMYRHRDPSTYPYACDMCPKRFVNKYAFQTHQNRHRNIRNFQCTQCETRTYTKAELVVHMAFHNKELTVQCDQCPNRYTTKLGLYRHMRRVHEGRKPYVCSHCGLSFGQKSTMRNHMMRHTGEKPHACPICDRRFTQLTTMKTHMKVHDKQPQAVQPAATGSHQINEVDFCKN